MFKKLKDKLAEEVKSSPQRIQQFAQAAQAAVTSASSSISDITNSDLFSIGDNDSQHSRSNKSQSSSSSQQNTFQEVSLIQPLQHPADSTEYISSHDILNENPRQRRLSNSSFASDVSFRLPSYETPSMYHLQSDMEVSASEAEERGFSSGAVSLDRVTKEQLYAAYRRTQERYTKYRTQYGDLARHYKLLERENAKARSVLVETQDKALRRISELREQCSLEQSAKAHLEKALRIEIEEKNMKIETLNTKIQLLKTDPQINNHEDKEEILSKTSELANEVQLINLSNGNELRPPNADSLAEITALNIKVEKMEQLLNKYKDSLKHSKEKNSQTTTELQILSNELENKNKEVEKLKDMADDLVKAKDKIEELNNLNEELQNKINVYEFTKTREQSTLEIDFQKAQEEIAELRGKIEVFGKREEEYAISLAENKLSIHKELESKESEIKSLKDSVDKTKKEIQSLNIVVSDYKNNVALLEAEQIKLNNDCKELVSNKTKIADLEMQVEELSKKCHNLEQAKTKADEEYKCLQLQLKQETAEKLAMIDRNMYLENRNTQISEENTKKSLQINNLENELHKKEKDHVTEDSKKSEILCELNVWKDKYAKLESEIQEEREELIKLQSEIEKLLANHELLQTQNVEFRKVVSNLESDNAMLQQKVKQYSYMEANYIKLANDVKVLRTLNTATSDDTRSFQIAYKKTFDELRKQICHSLMNVTKSESDLNNSKYNELNIEKSTLEIELKDYIEKYDSVFKEFSLLQDENIKMQGTLDEILSEKETLSQKLKQLTNQYENGLFELNSMKDRNENLEFRVMEYENKIKNLEVTAETEKANFSSAVEKLNFSEKEKQSLEEKYQEISGVNSSVTIELNEMKTKYTNIIKEYDMLKMTTDSLNNELDNKNTELIKFQEEIKNLSYENLSLRGQTESIAVSLTSMEVEINDLRKSHCEIEAEKDRLNKIIEKLESSPLTSYLDKDIQTEDFEREIVVQDREVLDDKNVLESTNIESMEKEIDNHVRQNNELSESYNSLKNDYDLLKEENRRYKSDIEGLQTYLTKISKENSVLNDKLRELIATSEHSTENNNMSCDLGELQSEVQLGRDKIDDLLRENNLLVEENLELKDQLQSQNYFNSDVKSFSDKENTGFKEKYNNLLQVNSTLESRLIDSEQMNKAVNINTMQLQEQNEKLRLSNEKLERRLDEALVSLRHLHSLQENTELEYLRNILYEYLTGSGMHSVTLAKVLSAIVKFDDMQTKLVLQKEKERQGFLRQLGII